MANRLNLNDDISDVFQFTINGLDYDLRYPTLKELEPIQKLNNERNLLQGDESEAGKKKLDAIDKKLTEAFYGFVEPVGHTTPIEKTLENSNVLVVKAFNDMVQTQLSGE